MTFEGYLIAALAVLCAALAFMLSRSRQESAHRFRVLAENAETMAALSDNYHQKLRALADSSAAAILMLDRAGIVVHANAMAERVLGVRRDAIISHALIQATLSSEMQQFVASAAYSGAQQARDFPMPGAPSRILRASVYPFSEGLSGDAETMLVLTDVTELRRLETIRQDFVANVSHELRTPLASIRAMAETLLDGARTDEEVAERFLETIIREADRLARVAHDLLVLSDAESKAPARERFDLVPLLEDVVSRYQPHAHERGIDLHPDAQPPLEIDAAHDQIEQVLVNLVDNAIKYTSEGGTVKVSAGPESEGVRIVVSDTGIGILEEHLPRIFERFYRVDKARSRESGGTGLGLSIVKNIVEAHGGNVSVESRFNRGSSFVAWLPKPIAIES